MRIGSLVAKGVATFEVGAVGSPSITFSGSTTSGLFADAVGKVNIATNSANVFEIDTTGLLTLKTNYDGLIGVAGSVGNDQVAVTKKWVEDNFVIGQIGTLDLGDLADVTLAGPVNGDFLVRTGGVWVDRDQSEAQTDLALVPGTDVQVQDQQLQDIADAGAPADNEFLVGSGGNWTIETDAQARSSLGLVSGGDGDIWVEKAGDTMTGNLVISSGFDITLPDTPTAATDAVNKSYVDNLVTSGAVWIDPISNPDLVGIADDEPTAAATGYGTEDGAPLISGAYIAYGGSYPQYWKDTSVSGAVVSKTTGTNTIVVVGDLTSDLAVTDEFILDGAAADNGVYTIATISYGAPNTTITTNEAISSTAGAVGTVYDVFTVAEYDVMHWTFGNWEISSNIDSANPTRFGVGIFTDAIDDNHPLPKELRGNQDETNYDGAGTNGTFAGGTGWTAPDIGQTITVSDGSTITIDNVAAGAVTEFSILTPFLGAVFVWSTLSQTGTTGGGTGFSLTLGTQGANTRRDALTDDIAVYTAGVSGNPLLNASWNFPHGKACGCTYDVDTGTASTKKFVLHDHEGDLTNILQAGNPFIYSGGTASNGPYTIVSATYVGSNTEVVVSETLAGGDTTGGAAESEIFDGATTLVNNSNDSHFGQTFLYQTSTEEWIQISGPGSVDAGVGLSYSGTTLNVNLGPGLFENPSDQVAIELHNETTGAIILTTDGSSREEDDNDSRLHLLLDTSGTGELSQGANGLKVAANGITGTEIDTSAAGDGLGGGGGSALSVNAGDGIEIVTDNVTVDANSTFFQFTTGELDLVNSSITAGKLANDYVDVSGDTMTGDLVMNGGDVHLQAGSANDPSLAFASDPDTGLYSVGINQIGVATDGTLRVTFNTSDVTSTIPYLLPDGTTNNPAFSFSGDTNTGMWSSADDTIDLSTGGVARFQIESDGTLNVAGTSSYEALVTSDDDIPNLKKVNDLISLISTSAIIDADLDTKVDVEEGADDDTIRMDTGDSPAGYGVVEDIFVLNSAGWTVGMGTADAATVGAPISITAGTGNTTGIGGDITATAGQGGATGAGGVAKIYGGAGGATSGAGGVAGLYGGDATTSGAGGDAIVEAGTGLSAGGDAKLLAGASTGTDAGGEVVITGGAGGVTSGIGGVVNIDAGAGGGSGDGGTVAIDSGAAGTTGNGGPITLTTTKGGSTNAHKGGRITLDSGRDGLNTSRGAYMYLDGGGTDGAGQGGDTDIFGGFAPTQGGHVNLQSGSASGASNFGATMRLDGATTAEGGRAVISGGQDTDGNGGDIQLYPGRGSGDSTKGFVEIVSPIAAQSAELRISKSNGGNYIGFTIDTGITADAMYTLPALPVGNDYALVSQTDGTLSWFNLGTGLDNSKITDAGAGTAETYIDTDEATDTITSKIGVTGNYPQFEPLNISSGATGTAIKAASATSGTNAGRPVTIDAGAAYGGTTGGEVKITTGNGAPAGDFKVYGGYNTAGGNGGTIYMKAGDHPSSMGAAGDIKIYGGVEVGEYSPAELVFSAGAVNLKASYGLASDNVGDIVLIKGGNSFGDGNSGNVRVYAGSAPGAGDGGVVQIKAGDSASGALGYIELDTTGTGATTSVVVRFNEAPGSTGAEYIGLRAPNDVSTSRIWTLPQNAPVNNYVLKTDGSGNMAWEDLGTLAGSVIAFGDLSDILDTIPQTDEMVSVLVGDGTNKETQMLVDGTNLTMVVDQGGNTVTLNVDDAFIANQGGDSFGDTGSGTWTVVSGSTLDAPTGAVISMADLPTAGAHLTNKNYVDSLASGLDPKESVVVATTADLDSITWGGPGLYNYTAGTGGTGAFVDINLSVAIDGITVAIGERVLVKDQANQRQNGIYIVRTGTSFPTQALLERAPDHDGTPTNEVTVGNHTFIEEGTQKDTGWVTSGTMSGGTPPDTYFLLSTNGTNGDNIVWTQFTGAGSFTAGIGISQSGNVIDVDVDDLTVATIVTADSLAFHDANGTPETSGSQSRKTTVTNFLSDLNILTGTVGGSLTATDGVLITASDVIELDITNLGPATIVGADELVFDDGASGTHAKTTVTNFLTNLNIANRAYTSTGLMTHTADDTWAIATISASATNDELGAVVNNGTGGTGSITIGLDIVGLTPLGAAPAADDSLPMYDLTGTVNRKVTVENLGDAIAATINIGDLADVTADSSSDADGNVLVADGSDSYDTQKIQHIQTATTTTSIAINHNIGQQYVIVQCYDSSDVMVIPQSVTLTDANNCTVTFSPSFTGKVVIMGIPGVPVTA